MLNPLSTSVMVLTGLGVAGCTDPGSKFDDFGDRVIDAAPRPDAPVVDEIPDITGTFYVVMSPVVAPDRLFHFSLDVVMTTLDGKSSLDMTIQPLDRETLLPVGDSIDSNDIAVSNAATFEAPFAGTLPARANPITGSDLNAEIVLMGTIRSANLFCGPLDGQVTSPFQQSLTDSSFGAQRIDPGTTGTALPTPIFECPPEDDEPDAGVPDAGPADAGPADAGPADAAPDAAPDAGDASTGV